MLLVCLAVCAFDDVPACAAGSVRLATFNVQELSRAKLDEVDTNGRGKNEQLLKAAEIIRRVRPSVLVLNEIDFDEDRKNAKLFVERYLNHPGEKSSPINYPHQFFEPTNTGYPSGKDFDNDGKTDGPADAYGYGKYPGQYGMAILSMLPIQQDQARTFQQLRWRDMPNNLMPDGSNGKPAFHSEDDASVFRLSSKNHWDVPIQLSLPEVPSQPGIEVRTERQKPSSKLVHLLVSHPTPPIFDGPEDNNGRRNYDEIRMWADYLTGGGSAAYLKDDRGSNQPFSADAAFVIMGDLNADPLKGETVGGKRAIDLLLKHPRVQDPTPSAAGGAEDEKASPGAPKFWERKTCHFGRIDYCLPSKNLEFTSTGIFWPSKSSPDHVLVANPNASSDHRLVWIDIKLGN